MRKDALSHATNADEQMPVGNAQGFRRFLRQDAMSGCLVFLIALPLCLGISVASGFPPIAGIFTAIIGGIVTSLVSNSELTIKGPAAGMIVIVLGCVAEFGGDGTYKGFTDADMAAYRAALAVAVAAAVLQIGFGVFRAGILGEFFPMAAVHGMLAAIGVIIISKQIPVALGVEAKGEPLELLSHIPHFVRDANPAIACIGVTSVLIMFLWPLLAKRLTPLKRLPAAIIVLAITVPMGLQFDLTREHVLHLRGHDYPLGEKYLVSMPDRPFGMFDFITTPDFSALQQPMAWKWVFLFFAIGTLESLLSAKAIEMLDPWKRKTDLDRDVLAVGSANLCAALVGGLPMISEIVRSKANIDNGARTRFANLWHALFLLLCVALIPVALHRIPLAALAGMLVYTGFRLAHPSEFLQIYRVGREQLLIFVVTLTAVLATDLLVGIAIGIALKIFVHALNGVPLSSMFKTFLDVETVGENTCVVHVHRSAVFSNWIPFRRQLEYLGMVQRQNVVVDLSQTVLVDHNVMDKLHELEQEFTQEGLALTIIGLERHQPASDHERAARKRIQAWDKRITVLAIEPVALRVESALRNVPGADYVVTPGLRGGPSLLTGANVNEPSVTRIEVIADPPTATELLRMLRRDFLTGRGVVVCVENVEALRSGQSPYPVSLGGRSSNSSTTDGRTAAGQPAAR